MARRMRWDRKPARHVPESRRERDLDRRAHMILQGDHKHHEQVVRSSTPPPVSGARYRARASVVKTRDGRWLAVDGDDTVLSEHGTRWQAWQAADLLGMEEIH